MGSHYRMTPNIRDEVMDAIDEGMLDPTLMVHALLLYMNPTEIRDCLHANDIKVGAELQEMLDEE